MTIVWSILAGAVLGSAFTLLKLPLPAPITLAGVAGIFGVWAGYEIVSRFTA